MKRLGALELPAELWVSIAGNLSLQQRLQLGLVCKQLFQATRTQGAALYDKLHVPFASAAALDSFAAFQRRCPCTPSMLVLQHGEWDGEPEPIGWEAVVDVARPLLPSLTHLLIKYSGAAVAGDWLRGASRLQDLGLYCASLATTDALAALTQLQDLSLESTNSPLTIQSGYSLPPSTTKFFAVESNLAEVPEALTLLTRLESAYLSRNPLEPGSLSRLAPLRTLRLLSLIGCWFMHPPRQLSALTSLRALYLDYNQFGTEDEGVLQQACSEALAPLTGLQALGLSHNLLDSWPEAAERLPQLAVLYMETNPGIAALPPSAAAVLARLRVLSCDMSVLFSNAGMFARSARRLEHLFVSGSGLMWHAVAAADCAEAVMEALAALHERGALRQLTFVVQSQREELASVEVAQLMLGIGRRCPSLGVQALDSEAFFGVTLSDLEAMAAGVAEAGGGDRGAAPEADETGGS